MLPYKVIPFVLSEECWNDVIYISEETIKFHQIKNDPNFLGGPLHIPEYILKYWYKSKVCKYMKYFTNEVGLNDGDPQVFYYFINKSGTSKGSPHIDCAIRGSKNPLPVRFNLLVSGDETQEVVWWNKDINHPDVILNVFKNNEGDIGYRYLTSGNTKEERYKNAGNPDWIKSDLLKIQKQAAFIRADLLHCVNWDGKIPRILFGLKFPTADWKIIDNINIEKLNYISGG